MSMDQDQVRMLVKAEMNELFVQITGKFEEWKRDHNETWNQALNNIFANVQKTLEEKLQHIVDAGKERYSNILKEIKEDKKDFDGKLTGIKTWITKVETKVDQVKDQVVEETDRRIGAMANEQKNLLAQSIKQEERFQSSLRSQKVWMWVGGIGIPFVISVAMTFLGKLFNFIGD